MKLSLEMTPWTKLLFTTLENTKNTRLLTLPEMISKNLIKMMTSENKSNI